MDGPSRLGLQQDPKDLAVRVTSDCAVAQSLAAGGFQLLDRLPGPVAEDIGDSVMDVDPAQKARALQIDADGVAVTLGDLARRRELRGRRCHPRGYGWCSARCALLSSGGSDDERHEPEGEQDGNDGTTTHETSESESARCRAGYL